jgi:transposase
MPEPKESRQSEMWDAEAGPPDPEEGAPEPPREPRLKRVNRQQLLLRTVDVERLVETGHLVRAIWELVGRMDRSRFQESLEAVEGAAGRPAWDPQLLISLWIYAYSDGVSSAREVERRCGYHPAYQWLTGMEVVNHHTLSDFRVQHQPALDELFAQGLAVLSAEGLITLEQVMHDGTKVKASASGRSFHREETLRAHLEAAQERVQQMGDPRQHEIGSAAARSTGAGGAGKGGTPGTSPGGDEEGADGARGAKRSRPAPGE